MDIAPTCKKTLAIKYGRDIRTIRDYMRTMGEDVIQQLPAFFSNRNILPPKELKVIYKYYGHYDLFKND